jgi:hypothetical protein
MGWVSTGAECGAENVVEPGVFWAGGALVIGSFAEANGAVKGVEALVVVVV